MVVMLPVVVQAPLAKVEFSILALRVQPVVDSCAIADAKSVGVEVDCVNGAQDNGDWGGDARCCSIGQ
jgi:hypothetical protein